MDYDISTWQTKEEAELDYGFDEEINEEENAIRNRKVDYKVLCLKTNNSTKLKFVAKEK